MCVNFSSYAAGIYFFRSAFQAAKVMESAQKGIRGLKMWKR
jgi:hypothetical protein